MPTEVLFDAVNVILGYGKAQLLLVPGMPTVVSYIQKSYQNDPFRVGLEALLVFFTLRYLLSKPKQNLSELTPKVI